MRILIVEDVTLVAERISDLCKVYFEDCITKISHTLTNAKLLFSEEVFDLLFLDLNLNGEDGFEILKHAAAASFQTIIITANRDQASKAFDYGVFDFISKPITEKRFKLAIERFQNQKRFNRENLKFLSIKSKGRVELIKIEDIIYIKASGNYSIVFTSDKQQYLHDKNLDKLLKLLPDHFIRIHRSYVIPKNNIESILKFGAGKYKVQLNNGDQVPLSREAYKEFFLD